MAVKYIIFEWNFDNFALIRLWTVTLGVFEVADYESEVRISKFETADKLSNFMSFLEVILLYGRI